MIAQPDRPLLSDPKQLLLDLAEERRVEGVLDLIVRRLASSPRVALARVWLRAPGSGCETCPLRAECPDRSECLHLTASAGRSRTGARWDVTDGTFRRFPLGVRKVGWIGAHGEALEIPGGLADSDWVADPTWAREEQIDGFVGQPLLHHGRVLGVLAVFSHGPLGDGCLDWLRMIANHAAAAIANARAFEEIERLRAQTEADNAYLREEVATDRGTLLGQSEPMEQVRRKIQLVAATDSTVLILGESGTGKELVARELHRRSRRAQRPLVRVNCAAIPRELFESEFFGHAKGSFTGALRDRVGRFELAHGSTLFLDEVGEIPLDLQAKLLRVLQEGEFERVGEARTRTVDVRVLAATHQDLKQRVERGEFRTDLFYRLSVFPLEVPPLRERAEDVPELVERFLHAAAARLGRTPPRVPPATLRELQRHTWPGNVRELQHVIERALLLSPGRTLELSWSATPSPTRPRPTGEAERVLTVAELRELEVENLRAALRKTRGQVAGAGGAAELLGLKPTTLASRLKASGIDPHRFHGTA
ncbi:MAG: sigma 54-interacting transcriptional regulator [Planctomycetota bacterium]